MKKLQQVLSLHSHNIPQVVQVNKNGIFMLTYRRTCVSHTLPDNDDEVRKRVQRTCSSAIPGELPPFCYVEMGCCVVALFRLVQEAASGRVIRLHDVSSYRELELNWSLFEEKG